MKILPIFMAFLENMNFIMTVGTGGEMSLPDFDGAVTPISTKGTDYAHHITTSPQPLQIFRTSYGPKWG